MHIVCPSCDAAYEVADSLVIPGRIVRCSRCGGEWVALRIEAPVTDDEPEPEPFPDVVEERELEMPRLTAMDRLAQTARAGRRRDAALRAAWAGSIVLLLVVGWAGYAWRADVMQGWPASTRLYAALGLAAPLAH